jgi:PAS domain S-box-containing protein
MATPLRLLLVEDDPHDAELIVRRLQRAGFEVTWERVDTEAAYVEKIRAGFDLVISDHAMPQFSGLRALELLRGHECDTPFILVSATIGEESAVRAIKQGANDYLMKDRLTRLGAAVAQALEQTRLRRERLQAEKLLRETAASMTAAQEVGHFGSWELDLSDLTDLNRNQLRWSPQCFRIFGFEPGAVAVTNELFFSLVHPDDRAAIQASVAAAVDQRRRYLVEHRIVHRSGEVRHVREAGCVFFDEASRRPTKLVGTVHDITEERRADAALREAHALLHHLVSRSPTVIYQLKVTGAEIHPHFISENVRALTGFTAGESLDAAWWRSHLHPADHALAMASMEEVREAGVSRIEYRVRHRDGRYLWLEDRKRLMPGLTAGEREIVGGWTDITARKQAEEVARETEERFRQVVENIREVFWMTDVGKNVLLYVSPGFETIWGRPCQSLYASAQTWVESIHAEDRQRVVAATARQIQGTYDETYRIVRPDGAVRWIRDRAYPIASSDGTVRRVVGVAEDVTGEREMEAKFLRAQRLEAIGTLSSGLAHDLNNILAPMLMATGLLRGQLSDPRGRELLAMIESGAQRGASIISQLLTFSRGIEGARVTVQWRHLIREIIAIARETFPRNIAISEKLPRDLQPVSADATQLHQVLLNLCVNARDAMPDGGRLTLGAENVELTAANLPLHPDAKPGAYVRVTVADTGVGIPPDIIERIFDPFFTTKGLGKGTGLGLSTALGIVKSHGGFITVESLPEPGTKFHVYLPAEIGGPGPCAAGVPPAPARGQGELLLFVDDEEAICRATASALDQWNYRVISALDGRAGLALFEKHRADVRLVITDLMMPVMSGQKMIEAMRALDPQLNVIATTGLEPGERRAELRALGVREILMKPYEAPALLHAIAAALQRG